MAPAVSLTITRAPPQVWSLQSCARHQYNEFRQAVDSFVERAYTAELGRLGLGEADTDKGAQGVAAEDTAYKPWPKTPPGETLPQYTRRSSM